MSSQPSHKTPAWWQAHDTQVTEWARRLWGAIPDPATYRECHEIFFKEFKKLSEAAQGRDSVSMLNHVAPIYNHVASQGYQAHIHHLPLKQAVCNFCELKPVADWKGPPNQFSQSDEAARSDRNDSEIKSAQPRKPLPCTDRMDLNLIKCTMCELRSHPCHINSKTVKAPAAACFECNQSKAKCSLFTARTKKGEAAAEQNDEQEEEVAPIRRRKPTQAADEHEEVVADLKEPASKRSKQPTVPAGQPSQSVSLTREILEEVLSQAINRVASEQLSMQERFEQRLEQNLLSIREMFVSTTEAQSVLKSENLLMRELLLQERSKLDEITGRLSLLEAREASRKVPADADAEFVSKRAATSSPSPLSPPSISLFSSTLVSETAPTRPTMPKFPRVVRETAPSRPTMPKFPSAVQETAPRQPTEFLNDERLKKRPADMLLSESKKRHKSGESYINVDKRSLY